MKGIIVLNKIPATCQHIRGNEEDGCPFGGMVCQVRNTDATDHVVHGTKPDWCPIKPLPEKLPEHEPIAYKDDEGSWINRMKRLPEHCGWNACLDVILED